MDRLNCVLKSLSVSTWTIEKFSFKCKLQVFCIFANAMQHLSNDKCNIQDNHILISET